MTGGKKIERAETPNGFREKEKRRRKAVRGRLASDSPTRKVKSIERVEREVLGTRLEATL